MLAPFFQANLLCPPSLSDDQASASTVEAPANQTQMKLPNPKAEAYQWGNFHLISDGLTKWSSETSYSTEQLNLLRQIAEIFADSWHTSLPVEKALALTTYDFSTMVEVIRNLRGKVGASELAVMVLLALIVEQKMYQQIGCRSDTEFFRRNAEVMGISSSRARDYCQRGAAFLKYRMDILEGVGGVSGISLDEFVTSHMSKLTLYERAVVNFGREGTLSRVKSLTFRDFQAELAVKKMPNKNSPEKSSMNVPSASDNPFLGFNSIHEIQKAQILELNLSPEEKGALRIIAKGGRYYMTKYLTEEQAIEVETRLRQRRVEAVENNLKMAPIDFQRKSYDSSDPLAISDDLYELNNINDIILRIRSGLTLLMPARRTIAILTYRVYIENELQWKSPRMGVKYKAFRDFAMNELGMGEDYRDYLAVGKVIKDYYYLLDGLSDMDTETVFLKLRYLPNALKSHKGDEPLILARLRSLTVREFKLFSDDPDFEIIFSKKLTKKQLKEFNGILYRTRNYDNVHPSNFIEIFDDSERSWVDMIVEQVLAESEEQREHLQFLPSPANESED
jgi:hypothetical protein